MRPLLAHAASVVAHASGPGSRLDRDSLQGARRRPRQTGRGQARGLAEQPWPHRQGIHSPCRTPTHPTRRWWRRYSAHGLSGRGTRGWTTRRPGVEAVGADGFGNSLPVPRTPLHRRGPGHSGRDHRSHAPAGGMGCTQPPRHLGGLRGLLRRLCHGFGERMAGRLDAGTTAGSGDFLLWPDAHVESRRQGGAAFRRAVPSVAGGIHGLRRRRLRRLRRARRNA